MVQAAINYKLQTFALGQLNFDTFFQTPHLLDYDY